MILLQKKMKMRVPVKTVLPVNVIIRCSIVRKPWTPFFKHSTC